MQKPYDPLSCSFEGQGLLAGSGLAVRDSVNCGKCLRNRRLTANVLRVACTPLDAAADFKGGPKVRIRVAVARLGAQRIR